MTEASIIVSQNAVCKGLPQTARLLRLRRPALLQSPWQAIPYASRFMHQPKTN